MLDEMAIQIGSDLFRNAILSSPGHEFAGNIWMLLDIQGAQGENAVSVREQACTGLPYTTLSNCYTRKGGDDSGSLTFSSRNALWAEARTLSCLIWLVALGSEELRSEFAADVMSRRDSFHNGYAQGNIEEGKRSMHILDGAAWSENTTSKQASKHSWIHSFNHSHMSTLSKGQ